MTIISFHYKYIFIANPKTGSTSIHDLLSKKYTKPGDIIAKKSIHEKPIGKHDTYEKIKQYLTEKNQNIDDFYIFSFIREPFKRLISSFNYELNCGYYKLKVQNPLVDFTENFLNPNIRKHFSPNIFKEYFYCNNTLPSNLYIYKIEEVIKFSQDIKEKCAISISKEQIPHIHQSKKIINPTVPDLIKLLSKEKLNELYHLYEDDFKEYYTFDEEKKEIHTI